MNASRLETVLKEIAPAAVAISGGVDSTTLAVIAGRVLGENAAMYHAVSPAVPVEATRRVRSLARQENWDLSVIDAGEFLDEDYLKNPANRCFYCKTNLYDSIEVRPPFTRVSGTNLDDLSDVRPGLKAAENYSVRHPYVEAGFDKAAVRALAKSLGLDWIAEMPSAPCLSSRVETGLRIEPETLGLIHAAERYVRRQTHAETVRCRRLKAGVVIELDQESIQALSETQRAIICESVSGMFKGLSGDCPVTIAQYRRGSAFKDARTQ